MNKKSSSRIFSNIRKNSLTTEMWLVLFGILLVFGIVFIFSLFAILHEARTNNEMRESETLTNSVAGSIHANIDNYKDLSRLIMINKQVTTFLRADKVGSGLINDTKYGVMDILNVSENLDSVFILRNDGSYASTGRGEYTINFSMMDNEDWFTPIFERRGGAVILMNAGGAIYRKNGIQLITIARAIYDIYTQEQTGILLMNISTKMLDKITNVGGNTKLCIVSNEGVFLSGDDNLSRYFKASPVTETITYTEHKEKGKHLMVSSFAFDSFPLTIICSSTSTSYRLSKTTIIVLISLFVVFALAMIASSYFVINRINKPLFSLSKAMEKTKESGWIEEISLDVPDNEIGNLIISYNSMIIYMKDLFTKLIENEKSMQRAEMRVLHEQIKPHFLYNSLGTISYMAYEAGATDVYNALESLGSFYRNFLSKGDREITIKREIAIIKDYLTLQKLRYGDILTDEYDIDTKILEMKVPKLLLQPLVENCIYHGIRPKGEEGIIKITGRFENDNIVLNVRDSGVGMSRADIAKVLSGEKNDSESENTMPSGFGLRGTIDRIRYYCGNDDVVTIDSIEGEYTEITIKIPANLKEQGENNVQSNDNR